MDMQASIFADSDTALEWAKEYIAFDEAQLMRDYPWAKVFALESNSGETAFLKLVPMRNTRIPRINAVISEHFQPAVPETIGISDELGLQLIRHHGGVELDSNPNEKQRSALLRTYARFQSAALEIPALANTLPEFDSSNVLERFLDFLEPDDEDDTPKPSDNDFTVKAEFYTGTDEAAEYHEAFVARRELLTSLLEDAALLPDTLCHGDLRPENAAEADDGSIIIYDWDDASFGPAGSSLQAFFFGCFKITELLNSDHASYVDFVKAGDLSEVPEFVAQQEQAFAADKRLLEAYIGELAACGYAPEAGIRKALPAIVCAGAIQALLSYANYALEDDLYVYDVNEYFVKRLDDLLNLCDWLSCANRSSAIRFAEDYEERDILFRAGYIYRQYANAHPNDIDIQRRLVSVLERGGKYEEAIGWCNDIIEERPADADMFFRLGTLLLKSDKPEAAITRFELALSIDPEHETARHERDRTAELLDMISEAAQPHKLPPVRVSSAERADGRLSAEKTRTARMLFERHGALALEHVFDTRMLGDIKQLILDKYNSYFEPRQYDDCLRLGDKRHMVTLGIEGPLNTPDLYDNPYIAPLVQQILGKDYILGAVNIGVSLPGSRNQSIHKDYPSLFPENDEVRDNLPCFALAVLIPLVQHSHTVGTTLVIKDSHRINHVAAQDLPGQAPFLDIGGALMIDYRVGHQGLANTSDDVVRPLLTLIYHRCWFRDCVNYPKQVPVQIDDEVLAAGPERLKALVGWVKNESTISTIRQ